MTKLIAFMSEISKMIVVFQNQVEDFLRQKWIIVFSEHQRNQESLFALIKISPQYQSRCFGSHIYQV